MVFEFTTKFSTVNLNRSALDYELNHPSGMIGRALHKNGARMVLGARKMVGVQSGRLQRAIHYRISRTPHGQVLIVGVKGVPYARSHHEGTRPHLITPQRAQALRFSAGGRIVYARQVLHPGTKPNKYLSSQIKHVRL